MQHLQEQVNINQQGIIALHQQFPLIRHPFLSIDLSNRHLFHLNQDIPDTIQQLIVHHNQIKYIPNTFLNLRYVDLSYNLIKYLPNEFIKHTKLTTLKISHNLLNSLNHTYTLEHLQAHQNPIQLISLSLCKCPLNYFSCDWLRYYNPNCSLSLEFPKIQKFLEYIKYGCYKSNDKSISFECFYRQLNECNIYALGKHLFWAIQQNQISVIDIICDRMDTRALLHRLCYQDKLIFQYALNADHKYLLQKFKECQLDRSLNSYLYLCCKYSNLEFICHLHSLGFDINWVDNRNNSILHYILKYYNPVKSPAILQYIFHSGANFNHKNATFYNPLMYALTSDTQKFNQFLKSCLKHRSLLKLFDFNDCCGFFQQTILHFCSKLGLAQTLYYLSQLQVVDPLIRNFMYKTSRQLKSSKICKRLLYKIEKSFIRNSISNKCEMGVNETVPQFDHLIFRQEIPQSNLVLYELMQNSEHHIIQQIQVEKSIEQEPKSIKISIRT